MKRIKKKKRDKSSYYIKPGDQLWKLRDPQSIMGPRKYKSVKKLLSACLNYFRWSDNNPLYESKLAGSYKGEVMTIRMPKKRVYTYSGLYIHIGISQATWLNWNDPTHIHYRPEILKVKQLVDEIIRHNKFEGAAVGFFNANLIMRDLGLSDKQDLTSGGQPLNNSTTIQVNSNMDIKEAEKAYKQLLLG